MTGTPESLDPARPVSVYRNLTRQCWSLRQGGKIVGHAEELSLRDVRMTVQPGGQRRVRRTGHKTVHAWLTGMLSEQLAHCAERLHYDPYKNDHFCTADGDIHQAAAAHFGQDGQVHITRKNDLYAPVP